MSALKGFITAFCGGCTVLGLISILIPKNNISKSVRYAVSLAFLCVILSVSIGLGSVDMPKFSVDAQSFSDERMSAAAARMIFAEALAGENINFRKIVVFTDKSESGGISISKVLVYTAEPIEKVGAVIGSGDYELVVINE